MKAGICCTSAFRAVGATERTISPAPATPATRLPCRPGPNCATTIRPASASGDRQIFQHQQHRMINTGTLACDNEYLMGLEMLYIRGPFSFQAEYGWNWLNNASGILTGRRRCPDLPRPRLHVQRRIRPSGVHADRREPGLRQEIRLPVAVLLRHRGTVRKRLPRPRRGTAACAGARAPGKLPPATRYTDLNSGLGCHRSSTAASWTASASP